MKRYIVFAYTTYNLDTPISCIIGSFDYIDHAIGKLEQFIESQENEYDRIHGEILDCETMKEVYTYYKGMR